MSSKTDRRFLLDTSAVIYQIHGHTLQKNALTDATASGLVEVPVFVRMEYLRSVVISLIDMHSLIRESVTVEDALIDWSQQVCQERRLKVVLLTVSSWLTAQDNWISKDHTLERLGNYILNLIWSIDITFGQPPADPLKCLLGRVAAPAQDYADQLLLDFYERFQAIRQSTPGCNLCGFRRDQQQRLRRRKIDLASDEVRRRFASNLGFLRQSEQAREVTETTTRIPSCQWCARLGDTIIALHASRTLRIVTADRAFIALGELLGVPIILLPSLAELKRRADPRSTDAPGELSPEDAGL